MGKKLSLVVVGALLLTGCASGEPEAATPTVTVPATPEAAPVQTVPAPEETAGPGMFGNPEDDGFFIKSAGPALLGEVPPDNALIGAAKLACAQMDTGAPMLEVQVIGGIDVESDTHNNSVIGQYAAQIYCPEHNEF